jgi:hypothetical protein
VKTETNAENLIAAPGGLSKQVAIAGFVEGARESPRS